MGIKENTLPWKDGGAKSITFKVPESTYFL